MKRARVCLIGPSGVGKTHLAALLGAEVWQPHRVRAPRDPLDAATCLGPSDRAAIVDSPDRGTVLWDAEAGRDLMWVYRDFTEMTARGVAQVLLHRPVQADGMTRGHVDASCDDPLVVDVYAPVLAQMMYHWERQPTEGFVLDPHRTLVVLLNPLSTPIRCTEGALPAALSTVVASAVIERYRAMGRNVDVADVAARIEHLSAELAGWQLLRAISEHRGCWAECLSWPHYEAHWRSTTDAAELSTACAGSLMSAVERDAAMWAPFVGSLLDIGESCRCAGT